MNRPRGISSAALAAFAIAFVSLLGPRVSGQAPAAGAAAHQVGRTPWGDPDMRGVWDFQTLVPLERPSEFADKPVLTGPELAAWIKKRTPNDAWNQHHFVQDNRTSL